MSSKQSEKGEATFALCIFGPKRLGFQKWIDKLHIWSKNGVMYSRSVNYQNNSFFLFGPRGVGKSSWVQKEFKGSLQIDLLHAQTFNELLANPSRLEEKIIDKNPAWIVIDEIQKIPQLLDEVHRLIEKRKLKFVLTGSNARKLRSQGVNLLAGRAFNLQMFPLTVRELGNDFQFEKSIRFGHLPMAIGNKNPADYLSSYLQTYLKEEIQQEGLTRNISAFSRFLESASFSQGQYLNISKVAQDCSVERKVVEQYFIILEDLLIAQRLPVFTKKAKRLMTKHPKFFFFDAGVFRTIRPKGPLDSIEEIEGAAWETLVYQEIRAENHYQKWGFDLFCWQVSKGPDVDLVLYGNQGIKALEIKRTDRLRGGELDGLRAFKKDYSMADCFFIYGGHEKRIIDDIMVIPIVDFFKNMTAYLMKSTF